MKHLELIVSTLALILASGCSKLDDTALSDNNNIMSFYAKFSDMTKSSSFQDNEAVCIPFGEYLALYVTETDLPFLKESVTSTKAGHVITGDNFEDYFYLLNVETYSQEPDNSFLSNVEYYYDGELFKPAFFRKADVLTKWPDFPIDVYAVNMYPGYGGYLYRRKISYSKYLRDLLFAKAQAPANYSGSLGLTFNHICTGVRFVTSGSIASGTISSIKFKNIYNEGEFNCVSEKWENKRVNDYWSFNEISIALDVDTTFGESGVPITGDDETLFLIPQVCDNAIIEIEFKFEGETATTTLDIPLPEGFEFKMGKLITFSLGTQSDRIPPVTGGWFSGITDLN